MKEHNFYISVKYGLTRQLCEKEWWCVVSGTDLEEENALVEGFREFIKQIKEEK